MKEAATYVSVWGERTTIRSRCFVINGIVVENIAPIRVEKLQELGVELNDLTWEYIEYNGERRELDKEHMCLLPINKKGDPDHFTIITGNPIGGYECYGVFDAEQSAVHYANNDGGLPADWWIIPIFSAN